MTFWSNSDPATLDFMAGRVGLSGLDLQGLLQRDTWCCLVLAAGQAPVILQRFNFAEDPQFAGRFDG